MLPKITSLLFLCNKLRKVSDDFLHVVKHKSFLQIDTMIFDEDGQAFPESPK